VKCELKFDLLIGFDHWFEDNMEWSAMVDLEKVDHAFDDLIQKMLIFLSLFKVLERLNRVITLSYKKMVVPLTSLILITLAFVHFVKYSVIM
jgi:hypothetical protein